MPHKHFLFKIMMQQPENICLKDLVPAMRAYYAKGDVTYNDVCKHFGTPRMRTIDIIKNKIYPDTSYVFKPNIGVFSEVHFHERLAERYDGLQFTHQECEDLKSALRNGDIPLISRELLKNSWALTYAYVCDRYPLGPIFIGLWEETWKFSTAFPSYEYLLCNNQWLRRPHSKKKVRAAAPTA